MSSSETPAGTSFTQTPPYLCVPDDIVLRSLLFTIFMVGVYYISDCLRARDLFRLYPLFRGIMVLVAECYVDILPIRLVTNNPWP